MTDEFQTEAEKLAGDAKAGIVKIENVWHSHELYIVAAVCLIVGALIGHALK